MYYPGNEKNLSAITRKVKRNVVRQKCFNEEIEWQRGSECLCRISLAYGTAIKSRKESGNTWIPLRRNPRLSGVLRRRFDPLPFRRLPFSRERIQPPRRDTPSRSNPLRRLEQIKRTEVERDNKVSPVVSTLTVHRRVQSRNYPTWRDKKSPLDSLLSSFTTAGKTIRLFEIVSSPSCSLGPSSARNVVSLNWKIADSSFACRVEFLFQRR